MVEKFLALDDQIDELHNIVISYHTFVYDSDDVGVERTTKAGHPSNGNLLCSKLQFPQL